MVVKFDTPTKTASGALNNTASSSAFVSYLGKEDKLLQEQGQSPEEWFSQTRSEVHPAEVRRSIDLDHQGIGKAEGKFSTGSISPTAEEWQALGSTEAERLENFKKWVQEDFSKEFAGNFQKLDKAGNAVTIDPENVKIFYKVEFERTYTGLDEAVKSGLKRQGEIKEGFNAHCHFISARKTVDGQNRISPTTNNRKEFSRDTLKQKIETSFDLKTGYQRPMNQTYQHAKTMKNGTGLEKVQMLKQTTAKQLAAERAIARQTQKEMVKKVVRKAAIKLATGGLGIPL